MDNQSFNCMTPEVRRLLTFQKTTHDHDDDRKYSYNYISNSPVKLARAGFSRLEDTKNDEVLCDRCKATYSNWEGESPYAVHRVLNESCPFLSTPSEENAIYSHPNVVQARRQLFPAVCRNTSDTYSQAQVPFQLPLYTSVLNNKAKFSFPFLPKVGNASMLFASRRLQTFSDRGCRRCTAWADEGFVFKPKSDVQCVFCAVVLPFDSPDVQQAHAVSSAFCPQVLKYDVGNITRTDEELIRLKNLKQQLKDKPHCDSYTFCQPQYEEKSMRLGTFENWPPLAAQLKPSDLSEAGFYYTGCADKVKCYCCGIGLFKWKQGSDPWKQHALHMPTCAHIQSKGQNFLEEASQSEILTEVDAPTSVRSKVELRKGKGLWISSAGDNTMDMSAVMAALNTSQYSIADIRQAVLTFFCHTSCFPTKDILLGQLQAADVNFSVVCKQREIVHQQSAVLQQKDSIIEQNINIIEQKNNVIEQQETVIQQKDTVIEHQNQELQQHRGELQQHREELQQHREELQQQRAERERERKLIAFKEQQISSLMVQMQQLLKRHHADQLTEMTQAVHPEASALPPPHSFTTSDIRCKVCLSTESNTIFQPCHHITCCKTCAEKLVSDCCPVCRAPISAILPVYIA